MFNVQNVLVGFVGGLVHKPDSSGLTESRNPVLVVQRSLGEILNQSQRHFETFAFISIVDCRPISIYKSAKVRSASLSASPTSSKVL